MKQWILVSIPPAPEKKKKRNSSRKIKTAWVSFSKANRPHGAAWWRFCLPQRGNYSLKSGMNLYYLHSTFFAVCQEGEEKNFNRQIRWIISDINRKKEARSQGKSFIIPLYGLRWQGFRQFEAFICKNRFDLSEKLGKRTETNVNKAVPRIMRCCLKPHGSKQSNGFVAGKVHTTGMNS